MLDLNLPKNSYVFLRKHLEEGVYQVSAVSASDVLKRNTDSLRCAVENDVFDSLPQDSLLKNGTPHSRYFSDELGVPTLFVKYRTSVCYI